jgi:uncharacterized protein (TIGR02217 family)
MTLYAKWESTQLQVQFESNGGTAVDHQHPSYNGVATRPANPTKLNTVFAGWYTSPALTTLYDFATPVTVSITLYAKWIVNGKTVSFYTGSGSPVVPQVVEPGQTATQPAAPTKLGSDFVVWSTTEPTSTPFNFATPITTDLNLFAIWVQTAGVITFNSNGGTAVTTQVVGFGGTVAVPAVPTKSRYLFDAWCLDVPLTIPFSFSASVSGDLTLYARWVQATYTPPPIPPKNYFPIFPGLTWDRVRTPVFSNKISNSQSGQEVRMAFWTYPKYHYDFKYDLLRAAPSYTEMQSFINFFNHMAGSFNHFYFEDLHESGVRTEIATGDGVTTHFQLVTRVNTYLEPLQSGTRMFIFSMDRIDVDGVLVTNTTTDFATGHVTLNSTVPALGAKIYATTRFARRCRFLEDQMDFNEFMYQIWENKKVRFTTLN